MGNTSSAAASASAQVAQRQQVPLFTKDPFTGKGYVISGITRDKSGGVFRLFPDHDKYRGHYIIQGKSYLIEIAPGKSPDDLAVKITLFAGGENTGKLINRHVALNQIFTDGNSLYVAGAPIEQLLA